MNLHLPSAGPNLVELEIDDEALVIVRRIGSDRKVRVITPSAGLSPRSAVLAGALFCVLGVGLGYSVASRTAGVDPRYEAPRQLAAMPRALAAMPSATALPMPRPYSDLQDPSTAEQHPTLVPGSVPAAVLQNLSQRPVVMPPPAAQTAAPVSAAPGGAHGPSAGNAFGLE